MGMDADIIAIGKFKKEIAQYLDYPADYYDDTPEGAEIITSLFLCNSSQQSKDLAHALGIDPQKFEQCHFNAKEIDIEKLLTETEFERDDIIMFDELRKAGFEFYYRPNG